DDGDKDIRHVQHRSGGEHVGSSFKLVNQTDTAGKTKTLLATGVHIGTDYGLSQTGIDFVDINGDGLPDHVKHSGGDTLVRLNLGYAFTPEIRWVNPHWRTDHVFAAVEGAEFVADLVS